MSSFADDTRVGSGIRSNDDVESLQKDLNAVYQWAVQNNMEFNSDKFEHMRFVLSRMTSTSINSEYSSNSGSVIKQQKHVRDLGLIISDDATFTHYISEKVIKMKKTISWILRTFQTRDFTPMITLWRSLVLSEHDYCCQLWNP